MNKTGEYIKSENHRIHRLTRELDETIFLVKLKSGIPEFSEDEKVYEQISDVLERTRAALFDIQDALWTVANITQRETWDSIISAAKNGR